MVEWWGYGKGKGSLRGIKRYKKGSKRLTRVVGREVARKGQDNWSQQ